MADLKGTLTDVISSNEIAGLQAGLEIDRVRAAAMGVTPLAVDNTLYDAFGQRQIRTIYLPHNYSRVILEAGPAMQADPASLNTVFVPGTGGGQVPLAALTRLGRSHGTMWMVHSGQFPAATISFDTLPGVSIGDAIAAIRGLERTLHLPDDIRAEFRGEAGEATKAGTQQLLLFLAAIFAVYVVLGVLYESYAHPFTILTTLPPAIFGALLALRIVDIEFTLITTIGCILLVGMVMKNAIMLVDFALQAERQDGLAPVDAIMLAARRRVRPIVMTTLVAVAERGAACGRHRAGLRAAPAPGRFDRRRTARLATADAVHHAGDLSPGRTPAQTSDAAPRRDVSSMTTRRHYCNALENSACSRWRGSAQAAGVET